MRLKILGVSQAVWINKVGCRCSLTLAAAMDEHFEFQMSTQELDYLKQLASIDRLVAGLLRFRDNEQLCNTTVSLSRHEAEQLRSYLTDRLASVGFGDNYALNQQGRILEKLIDIFYIQ
jgi:hypothetical protein